MPDTLNASDPHAGQPILATGAPLAAARAAVVMIHGRGASAESILGLAQPLATDGVAYVAPQAATGAWYPLGFMSPMDKNEPWLSSAMRTIERVLAHVAAAGIPPERTVLLGFSQGACLATEYAARHAQRYGAIVGYSGGLIGPDGTSRDYDGTLDGTPVFLGCSDVDFHIPEARVRETGRVLGALGADVDLRIYPGMGHTVNDEELEAVRAILASVAAVPAA